MHYMYTYACTGSVLHVEWHANVGNQEQGTSYNEDS